MTKRVLVCGDRNWSNEHPINAMLNGLLVDWGNLVVIEGDARGADRIAGEWAETYSRVPLVVDDRYFKVEHEKYPADWSQHGRAAGPIRNRQMLKDGKPDLVVAFHNDLSESKGTKDMVTIARQAGVPVWVVSGDNERNVTE